MWYLGISVLANEGIMMGGNMLSVFRNGLPCRGTSLKEYYEIVGESRPLSAFFPTHADFFTEMYFYS